MISQIDDYTKGIEEENVVLRETVLTLNDKIKHLEQEFKNKSVVDGPAPANDNSFIEDLLAEAKQRNREIKLWKIFVAATMLFIAILASLLFGFIYEESTNVNVPILSLKDAMESTNSEILIRPSRK